MSEDLGVKFDEDYFLRGVETGKSLYKDYRWLPELTIPMVNRMAMYLDMQLGDTVLDYGCARGYTVKALRTLGYNAWGFDISQWAIDNCDPEVRPYVSASLPPNGADWIICKDCLEHAPDANLPMIIDWILKSAIIGFMVIVPLAPHMDAPYVISDYERDVTHMQRRPLDNWMYLFTRDFDTKFMFTQSYRLPGIKDNYRQYPRGNGFIMGHRL